MKTKFFVLFITAVMIFAMSGCGGSSEPAADEEQADQVEQAEEEDTRASGNLNSPYAEVAQNYVIELEGKEYSFPCSLSDFTNNGWYIWDEVLDKELESQTITSVDVYTDSSMDYDKEAFSLEVINIGDDTKKLSDCTVGGINLRSGYVCTSLTLKKAGVTVDISSTDAAKKSSEELKAAYGTDEKIYQRTDEDTYWIDSWDFHNMNDDFDLQYSWGEGQELSSTSVEGGDDTNEFRIYYHGPKE